MKTKILLMFAINIIIYGYSLTSFAQLSGLKTIDNLFPTAGNNYASFTDAFNDLNTSGVGAGGVTFEVSGSQTFNELPPVLNATGTVADPIVFIKAGLGDNPVIIPNAPGVLSTNTFGNNADGIIIINGGDYITFNGIDLNANSDSTTGAIEKYEYGYFLKKASGTNACKNVTILNSTISLQQNIGTIVSVGCGIYVSNISGTANVTVTSTGGLSENIKISSNSMKTCMMGIQVRGFNATTFRDLNNEIGVQGGNNIADFGGNISITTYGIYASFQENLKIANNIVKNKFTSGFSFQGITTESGTNSNLEIYGNTVTLMGSSTFYAIRNAMGASGTNNTVRIYDNVLTENESSSGSSDIHLINNSASCHKLHINKNEMVNNTHNGTGSLFCINQTGSVVDSINIYDNNIIDNLKTAGTTPLRCIQNSATTNSKTTIYQNSISGNSIQSTAGILYCINHSSGNTALIYRNRVHNNMSQAGQVLGITSGLSSGNSQSIYNNYVSELYTPDGSGRITGIELTGSGTHRLYYNTVYLDASSTNSAFETSGIYYNSSSGTCDLRNNIVINASEAGSDPDAYTVAFRKLNTSLTVIASATNNNNYYAGTPGPKNLIYYDGTDGDQTMGLYKNRVAPRDNNSFTELSPFVNSSIHPYDLRMNANIPTGTESGGQVISSPISITIDYDGDARYPNAGYPEKVGFPPTAPDIGADEFGGEPVDLVEPYISYTPLGPTSSLTNRTLTASVSDLAGIAGGANSPRLYYKKFTDLSYVFDDTPLQSGDDYTWTLDYAELGGVSYDDRIQYYVAAQDVSGNLSSVPGGAGGISPPGTVPSPAPNFYDIYNPAPMSGTYMIGYETFRKYSGIDLKFEKEAKEVINESNEVLSITQSIPFVNGVKHSGDLYYEFTQRDKSENGESLGNGVFPNFYAAILNLNLRGVNGPVTFLLNDASYDSETFPLVFDPVTGASSMNTITIKPNTGVSSVISGSSTNSVIKLNGADYFIFDGSNSSEGLSRDLTISNTIAGTNSAAIWISSLGAGEGAMNNVIKNCNISAGVDMSTATTSTYGIVSSGTTASTQVSINDGNGNDSNSFINNYITKCRYGMHIQGIAANLNSNVVISGNEIGPNAFGSESIGLCGIVLIRQTGVSVTGNVIKYIGGTAATTSGAGTRIGIGLGNNSLTGTSVINNANVSGNRIYELRDERNGSAAAIVIGASGSSTNNLVYNNEIHTILANISSTANRCMGIGIVAGDNDKVLLNSINMIGDLDPPEANFPAAQNAAGIRVTSATAVTNLTMMNNVVSVDLNSDNTELRHFTIIVPTSTFNWGTGALNYNDYFFNASNSQMALGGIGLANASMTTVQNIADWRALFSQAQDRQSMSRDPGFTSNTNLQPNPLNTNSWHVSGMGQIFSNIDMDINGNSRSSNRMNGAVDIGAYEFDPELSTNSPPVLLTEEITVGRTQEMFFADRKIGEIEWISGSALPSVLDVFFRAGINPPTNSSAPQISNAYWTADQTGGTDYVYDLRLDYDINQIGNIPYESNIRIGKLDGGNWVVFGNSTVDSIANNVSVDNLSSFSSFALSTSKLSLNVKVIPQGFYNTGSGELNSKDTIRVYLRNTSSPFGVVDSSIAVVDSVSFIASFDFVNATPGTYYIMVDHRNSINTWSKSGGENISSFIQNSFDFTSSAAQAFGNNQILVETEYCIYSGDVNKDGFVDLADVLEINNAAASFTNGYVRTDVNGDYVTDLTDMVITYNNAENYVTEVSP